MNQSSKKPVHYLSGKQAAELLGISRMAFYKRTPPPADAYIGDVPGWKEHTITTWDASVKKKPGPVPGSTRKTQEQ